MRTVDAIERVLPSSRVDWGFKASPTFALTLTPTPTPTPTLTLTSTLTLTKAEAATSTAPWVPNAAGTSGNGGGLRKASSPRKAGGMTSAGLKRWKEKAQGKAALRAAGVYSANPEQQSPYSLER